MFAPAQFALGNLDAAGPFCATPGLTVDTCSCSALGVAFGRISCVFLVKWCSDPSVDSRPAQSWFLLCSLRLSVFFFEAALVVDTGSGMCWLVLLVLMHLALCGFLGLRVLQHGEVYTVG